MRDAPIMKQAVGGGFRDRPVAYILPPDADAAVALLRRPRIQVERLLQDTEVDVHGCTMTGIEWGTADNAHRAAPRIEVETEVALSVVAPRGSWIVRTGQPLGRVVTHLLEPENTDNVFYWDRMTFLLPLTDLEAFEESPDAVDPPLLPI